MMAERCSPRKIADFIVLWGMTGKFPEYCEYAEEARKLQNSDLIISSVGIFVDAFRFNFEVICRKHKVNFPLTEEKFIEFLKPRCLLLTKDNKCFNFILVSAFVYYIIYSFAQFNKCFHLVKVASKFLAAILKNRFKEVFETNSGWEELMSFCIKIHGSVYPSKDESYANQLVGVVTDKIDATFSTMAQGLLKLSGPKSATKNNNDSKTGMPGKKFNSSLKNTFVTETEEKKLDLCNLELPTSVPCTHQFTGEDSFLTTEIKEKMVDENNSRAYKDCATSSSSTDLVKDATNMIIEEKAIRIDKVTENLDHKTGSERDLTIPFESFKAIVKRTERLEYICNLGLPSTDATHTPQLKVEDSSTEEKDKKEIYDESNVKKDNVKYCKKGKTVSSLHDLPKHLACMTREKTPISDIKEDTENFDQITNDWRRDLIVPFEIYEAIRGVPERLEDLCKLGLASSGELHALQLNHEDVSPKEVDSEERIRNENDENKNADCARDKADSSTPNLVQESISFLINNKDANDKMNATSSDLMHTVQQKSEDSSSNVESEDMENVVDESCDSSSDVELEDKENVVDDSSDSSAVELYDTEYVVVESNDSSNIESEDTENVVDVSNDSLNAKSADMENKIDKSNARDVNEKECKIDKVPDLAHKLTKKYIGMKVIDFVKDAKKLGRMIDFRKKLTLPLGEDSIIKDTTEKLNLCNLESVSLTDVLQTAQLRDKETLQKDHGEPINVLSAAEIRARITENSQHLSEIMNLLAKCEGDIDPNIFSPDEYNISINDSDEDEEKLKASDGISERSGTIDLEILESKIKSTKFIQDMKMAHSNERICPMDNPSDKSKPSRGESSSGDMSDERAYVYSNQVLESDDPSCSLCAGGMNDFFDDFVIKFGTKYPNKQHLIDLLRFDFYKDSE